MSLDAAFAALSDPTRRRVLRLVADRPRAAGEIANEFPVSRPAISKHLRVLRGARLVEVEQIGRTRIYRLRPNALKDAREWMEGAAKMWDQALDSFKQYVESGGNR